MFTAFAIIFSIFILAPIILWGFRNISRVITNYEISWISDNLKKIFLVSYSIALIFFILMIMGVAHVF